MPFNKSPPLRLRNIAPREGTETKRPVHSYHFLKLRNIAPREGTETQTGHHMDYGNGLLRNIAPREGTETTLLIVFMVLKLIIKKYNSPRGDGNLLPQGIKNNF